MHARFLGRSGAKIVVKLSHTVAKGNIKSSVLIPRLAGFFLEIERYREIQGDIECFAINFFPVSCVLLNLLETVHRPLTSTLAIIQYTGH